MNTGDNLEAVTSAKAKAIYFIKEEVIASVTNMNSMNHASNSAMIMDNSIGEHVTDGMGGNLVSVPITFMDKDNVGIIDPLHNVTLAASEHVNESRGSARESKGKKVSNTGTWKRKERSVQQKQKKKKGHGVNREKRQKGKKNQRFKLNLNPQRWRLISSPTEHN